MFNIDKTQYYYFWEIPISYIDAFMFRISNLSTTKHVYSQLSKYLHTISPSKVKILDLILNGFHAKFSFEKVKGNILEDGVIPAKTRTKSKKLEDRLIENKCA